MLTASRLCLVKVFNVLLDTLPTEWNGLVIDPGFQNGIQIMQAMSDTELTDEEKVGVAADLLFFDAPGSVEEALEGILWFLHGWEKDKPSGKKNETPVMDWDTDQWRIYSAFLAQYGIDLNRTEMHFWVFMGLLTTLEECSFTRVAGIRGMDLGEKMDQKTKSRYRELKKQYAIDPREEGETAEDIEAQEEFLRLAGLR